MHARQRPTCGILPEAGRERRDGPPAVGKPVPRKPSDEDVEEFRSRVRFLEDMWGVATEYEVDLASGIAWLRITRPDSPVAVSLKKFHIFDFLLPSA